jgi:multiple sugar transport system substrate-binding protein
VLHSDGYCVTEKSDNKPLARAFAAFAVQGDGARILAESGRTVPMLRSVAESEVFLDPNEPPASSQVWLDQLESVRSLPHTPTWNEAEGIADEVLTQFFAGELTLDQAIQEIATRSEQELAKA